jgi:hypothetical protein
MNPMSLKRPGRVFDLARARPDRQCYQIQLLFIVVHHAGVLTSQESQKLGAYAYGSSVMPQNRGRAWSVPSLWQRRS